MAKPYGVIVIPGMGGTQLSFSGGQGGKTALWFNPNAIVQYTPLALGLDTDGLSPWPLIGKKLFPDGPVSMGYYEPLITQLANDGLNPVFYGYDWRLSANVSANKLAIWIAQQQLTNPFYVVAHSMGGVIARLAYPLWKLQNTGQVWGTTIYLGSPHGGSYWASAMLSGLYSAGSWFQALANVLNIAAVVLPGSTVPFSLTKKVAGQLAGSWPGLYCLLPSNLGTWAGIDVNAASLGVLATYADTPGGQQQKWFDLFAAVAQALSTPATEQAPANRLNVLGQQESTLHSFKIGGNPGALSDYSTVADGDGTVPTDRASWEGTPTIRFKNTSHTGLTNTLGPLSRLKGWLLTPPTSDATLPNSAPVVSNPGGSTIDFIPLPTQTFVVKTGDP